MRMWARLQGVGISVRADTALPWPLLLLHKTSQPALSPGLESVSAATCQIKTKREKKKKSCSSSRPSCVISHPSPPLCPCFFASLLMSCACLTNGHIADAFRLSSAACFSFKLCLPFFMLPDFLQGNSLSYVLGSYTVYLSDLIPKMQQVAMLLPKKKMIELLWLMLSHYLCCLLVIHVIIASIFISTVLSSLIHEGQEMPVILY